MKYRYTIRALKHGNVTMSSIDSAKTYDFALKKAQDALQTNKYIKVDIERSTTVKSLIWTQKTKLNSKE